MPIKISIASAKRLGFSIVKYKLYKGEKTPKPLFKKSATIKNKKRKTIKKNYLPLKDCGRIIKLDLENI